MKRIHLSQVEKEGLEGKHRCCSNGKERDRIKAVLLRSESWTVLMIAQALRLHESTVIRHLDDYRAGKLTIASGGSESHLTEEQTQKLIVHLDEHTYHYVHDIIAYVEKNWSISYSVPGMNKWLHRNSFSYKKPKGHRHKANREQQDQFIMAYQELKKILEPDDAIYFADSVHPSQATQLAYGWIRKGQTKKVATTASRTRVNIIGSFKLDAIQHTAAAQYETINTESIVNHLHLIRANHGSKGIIYLILDQAPYHRADRVKEEAKKLDIRLNYLPPYSPNLNPIERLWKVMNEKVRNNRFFKNARACWQFIPTAYVPRRVRGN
ncbi:IS630 family transposase, partial [Legionella sp. PATHC038]|uniref:IS630 family transposase n=1 Tax=Legionella sheltonii TaxID=2992041 RepID=UPI0022440785